MSDEEGGGGETKTVLLAATGASSCISGDADTDASDKIGVLGIAISAGAPRNVWEDVSSVTLWGLRSMVAHSNVSTKSNAELEFPAQTGP